METIVGVFFSVVLLLVVTWVGVFGGIGALLSTSRGGSAPAGLAWGAGLGPFGWLAILWTTRGGRLPAEPDLSLATQRSSRTPPSPRPATAKRWDPWNG